MSCMLFTPLWKLQTTFTLSSEIVHATHLCQVKKTNKPSSSLNLAKDVTDVYFLGTEAVREQDHKFDYMQLKLNNELHKSEREKKTRLES